MILKNIKNTQTMTNKIISYQDKIFYQILIIQHDDKESVTYKKIAKTELNGIRISEDYYIINKDGTFKVIDDSKNNGFLSSLFNYAENMKYDENTEH
jgi:hypothetical protein